MGKALLVALALVACGHDRNNDGDAGVDTPNDCTPEGSHRCMGSTYQTCTGGQWMTAVDCPEACTDALGCVQCTPGGSFCMNGDVYACDDAGNPGMLVQQCGGANTCVGGACVDACADAAANKSYIACEYWAADLDNAIEVWGAIPLSSCQSIYMGTVEPLPTCTRTQGPFTYTAGSCDPSWGATQCPANYSCNATFQPCVSDAQHGKFGIVVSNPQAKDVHVVVTGPGGQQIMQTVAAGQVVSILPQMGGTIPDQSIDGTIMGTKAYKITSDLPIVAYQFNPLDNSAAVFSNDASLLVPRTAFDTDYYVMSWATLDRSATPTNPYYGYLTVVAWQDNTQIDITPTATVESSATQTSIAAGTTKSFTLNAGQVLQLEAAPPGDLTGTHVVSTNNMTFGMFGGHEAADFGETTPPDSQHTNGPCCADHLEEMLFPGSTWGMNFAIARSQPRDTEPDYIRVLAEKPGTSVTFNPAPSATVAGNCAALDVGQFCDVKIQTDTEITSTQPILVGQFLESAIWGAQNGTFVGNGDPSMAIAVPVEQYRTDYTVPVPAAYDMNYLSISAAPTGAVTLDGATVTLTAFPGAGTTHRVARVPVTAGQHTIHCPDGCGVLVYGYSNSVSYMFAGGLDLKQIVIL